jgi:hypothetical protein
MMPKTNRRMLVLAVATAGSALLQACAMNTGQFVPTPVRQPASRYDMLHAPSSQSMVLHRAAIAPGRGGMFDFRYY